MPEQPQVSATLVLIHGAWAGSWVWNRLTPLLRARGYRVITPDLPGSNACPSVPEEASMDACVREVVTLTETVETPLFLLGHSGGGAVATQAAEVMNGRVSGVIFLAGMMLPSGTGFADIIRSCCRRILPLPGSAPTCNGRMTETSHGYRRTQPGQYSSMTCRKHRHKRLPAVWAGRRKAVAHWCRYGPAKVLAPCPDSTLKRSGTVP